MRRSRRDRSSAPSPALSAQALGGRQGGQMQRAREGAEKRSENGPYSPFVACPRSIRCRHLTPRRAWFQRESGNKSQSAGVGEPGQKRRPPGSTAAPHTILMDSTLLKAAGLPLNTQPQKGRMQDRAAAELVRYVGASAPSPLAPPHQLVLPQQHQAWLLLPAITIAPSASRPGGTSLRASR